VNGVSTTYPAGSVAAAYEYSPFGEQLRSDAPDSVVADQPFRFSTKYTDSETGLVYYGRRYYDAKQGRFVGRDPIEEKGGLNLYAFVTNNPTNRWDYLGMISVEDLEAQIDSLRDKKQKLEQEENDAYVSKGTNQGKIDELNTQIEALEAQLAALRQPATQLPSFEVNDDRLPPITVPGVTPQAFRFVIPGINMPISTANALASLNKTIRCAGLANQIDAGNKLFQRFSKDLGDLLEFQRDANLTLYLVDRAIDAAAGIIGGGVGSAVKSASFGSGMAAASSTLTGQLAQSGMVTRAGITTTGKVLRVAEIWVTFGVTGTATGAGVNNALKLAAKLGPDGVRNQIQNTINSLEGDTTRMGTALSDLRAEFNKDC
jgi:RHS repeat-associated protein